MAGNLSSLGFGGASRVTSLPCGFGAAQGNFVIACPKLTTLSGTTVAGTSNLKTLLNITGSKARLNFLSIRSIDSTSRTARVVITVDGVVAFDSTTGAVTDTSARLAVGAPVAISSTVQTVVFQPVDANSSLKIEFGCSLAETDKLQFDYNYELRT